MTDQGQVPPANVVNLPLHCQTGTTFLDSLIPTIKLQVLKVEMPNGFRSTLLPSSALFVRNGLPVLTIYGLICVLILMSAHLYALYAVKHLPVNTTGNVTRDFTQERRSLFARENSNKVASGVAAVALPELMR